MKTGTIVLIGIGAVVLIGGTFAIISMSKKENGTTYMPPYVPSGGTTGTGTPRKLTTWEKFQIAAGLLEQVTDAYGNIVGTREPKADLTKTNLDLQAHLKAKQNA